MKKLIIILLILFTISCGPFSDKKDLREDENQLPDSIGTPGFRPDTTIRIDSIRGSQLPLNN